MFSISLGADSRKVKRIIAEDLDWSLDIVPRLSSLCLNAIVQNFEEKPILEELMPSQKTYVEEKLSPSLPLHLTANLISDGVYWKRCCKQRWDLCDVDQYDESWKRMFFERHLENTVEEFIPGVTDMKTVLDLVPLCRNYVKRLDISELLPSVQVPQQKQEEYYSNLANDSDTDVPSMEHFDFGVLLCKLTNLEELHLTYTVKKCGMNFDWRMFAMTDRDCERLAKALQSCTTLKVLRLHLSHIEDKKCRLLAKHLLDHPSLRELEFPHNQIGDRGARAIAKLLNRSKLETLNLYDNEIRDRGAKAIAHILAKNSTLLSLNLGLNCIADEGGMAISEALMNNCTLLRLHLGSNRMTEPTTTALSKLIRHNNSLKSINISANMLDMAGVQVQEDAMAHNTSITEIRL